MNGIVLPSGELLDLSEATIERIAVAFDEIAEAEREVRSVKREVQDVIIDRLDHEGRRQLTVDGFRVSATAPTEREYDLPALQTLLNELVDEGTISRTKADACVKWAPSAVWSEVKTLLSDPRCKERVAQTVREVPAHRYAKVTRA